MAILAAVIRGTPPLSLRNHFREAIETIHLSRLQFGRKNHPLSPVQVWQMTGFLLHLEQPDIEKLHLGAVFQGFINRFRRESLFRPLRHQYLGEQAGPQETELQNPLDRLVVIHGIYARLLVSRALAVTKDTAVSRR